jgi:hypothetical protein
LHWNTRGGIGVRAAGASDLTKLAAKPVVKDAAGGRPKLIGEVLDNSKPRIVVAVESNLTHHFAFFPDEFRNLKLPNRVEEIVGYCRPAGGQFCWVPDRPQSKQQSQSLNSLCSPLNPFFIA